MSESRVKVRFEKEVKPALMEKFQYKSIMQVPKLEKIVLNMGMGEAVQNSKSIQIAEECLAKISGQKPQITRAKKSIATFKLREGMPIGAMVTLRREKMYSFFDRLVSIALPRVRDFRGVPTKGFDGRGTFNMGLKDQVVFTELSIEDMDKVRGMDITFVTSADTDEEGYELLKLMGIPFRDKKTSK